MIIFQRGIAGNRTVSARIGQQDCSRPPSLPELLYTREQAAAFFSVSPRTIDAWTKRGRLRATRFDRLVRYHVDELQRVAREGVV